jgi:DNA invertase Pin-like site-specific DNA recombinase
MEKIDKAEAGFLSLTEAINTTAAAGRMMNMVGSFAEFERAMIRDSEQPQAATLTLQCL